MEKITHIKNHKKIKNVTKKSNYKKGSAEKKPDWFFFTSKALWSGLNRVSVKGKKCRSVSKISFNSIANLENP